MASNRLRFRYLLFTFLGLVFILLQFYTFGMFHRPADPMLRFASSCLPWPTIWYNAELSKDPEGELQEIIQQKSKNRSCKPHNNIYFLKTHKTASSSMINILFRYGEFHNLTFALPSKEDNQFFYPNYFYARNVNGLYSRKQQTFNILCHHMRFQLAEVLKVMPGDTFYFTILRNPVSLMESSFAYYKDKPFFANAKSLEQFISNWHRSNSHFSGFVKNFMTFDLGFDNNGPESSKYLQFVSSAVDKIFDLVLITEYFDESLVLLKDALCWTLDDVLSFPLNMRNSSKMTLSAETIDKIKRWNHVDWHLYTYFNNTFWNQIERFGQDRMQIEVKKIRKRREEMMEKCLENQADPSEIKDKSMIPYQSGLHKILGYNLNSDLEKADQHLCQRLVLPEVQYTALLLKKQGDLHIKHGINYIYNKRYVAYKKGL